MGVSARADIRVRSSGVIILHGILALTGCAGAGMETPYVGVMGRWHGWRWIPPHMGFGGSGWLTLVGWCLVAGLVLLQVISLSINPHIWWFIGLFSAFWLFSCIYSFTNYD